MTASQSCKTLVRKRLKTCNKSKKRRNREILLLLLSLIYLMLTKCRNFAMEK